MTIKANSPGEAAAAPTGARQVPPASADPAQAVNRITLTINRDVVEISCDHAFAHGKRASAAERHVLANLGNKADQHFADRIPAGRSGVRS